MYRDVHFRVVVKRCVASNLFVIITDFLYLCAFMLRTKWQ